MMLALFVVVATVAGARAAPADGLTLFRLALAQNADARYNEALANFRACLHAPGEPCPPAAAHQNIAAVLTSKLTKSNRRSLLASNRRRWQRWASEAAAAYRMSLSIDPASVTARRGLAAVLMRLEGREAEAIALLETLPEYPGNAGIATMVDILHKHNHTKTDTESTREAPSKEGQDQGGPPDDERVRALVAAAAAAPRSAAARFRLARALTGPARAAAAARSS